MNVRALDFSRAKNLNNRRILDFLVDAEVGVIQKIEEVPRFPGDPLFFHFLGKACNAVPLAGRENFYNSGGASTRKEHALFKAMGEAVERYCSAFYKIQDLPQCSAAEADFPHVDPEDFALYSDEQYGEEGFIFVPFTDDTTVHWAEMQDLTIGTAAFVPAAAVYMPYTYIRGERDAPILQPISTGLACHTSLEQAMISAICEIVERDGVMTIWQAMVSCPQIRVETLSDLNYDIVKRLERNGDKVIMVDITLDSGIPTILSILDGRNNPKHPAFIFAGAADPDPEKAACKSLEELPHSRRYCIRLMEFSPEFADEFPGHGNVKDQEHHLHFYCDHRHAKYAEFVFGSKMRTSFDEIQSLKGLHAKDSLANLIAGIRKTGEHVYVKDLTTPDVRELGLYVVRGVIPGYQRLCMGYQNRSLGGKRLKEVPSRIGLPSQIPPGCRDNPAPHPYP